MNTLQTVEEMYEVHGYFEQLAIKIGDGFRSLGTREIPKPVNRPLGVEGTMEHRFTTPLILTKGHKQVVIKASPEQPLVCFGIANATCGRLRNR